MGVFMRAGTRLLVSLTRRLLVVAALALALVMVGSALSASASSIYKGKVRSGGALRFQATATKVSGFQASVSPVCTSINASPMVKVYLIRGLPSAALRNGNFTIKWHGPSSTYITVTGKIRGSSASGSINIHYTLLGGGAALYACQFKGPWTAARA
jgi:hypothetical protein